MTLHSFINTLLQRCVLRGARRKTVFNGFYALTKTAEAVKTPHRLVHPNEKNPLRIARFVKHSDQPFEPRLKFNERFYSKTPRFNASGSIFFKASFASLRMAKLTFRASSNSGTSDFADGPISPTIFAAMTH